MGALIVDYTLALGLCVHATYAQSEAIEGTHSDIDTSIAGKESNGGTRECETMREPFVKTYGHPSEHKEQRAEDEGKGLGARGTPGGSLIRTREQNKVRTWKCPLVASISLGIKEPKSSQCESQGKKPSPNGESHPSITWRSPVRGIKSPAAPRGESAVMHWQLPPIQDKTTLPPGKAGHWQFQQFHSLVGRHSSLPQRALALTLSRNIKQSGRQTSYFHKPPPPDRKSPSTYKPPDSKVENGCRLTRYILSKDKEKSKFFPSSRRVRVQTTLSSPRAVESGSRRRYRQFS